jgi:YVTN family beta-propeller protein
VTVIDTAANTVATTIHAGEHPNGIAITPNGKRAYVTGQGSENISVIDLTNNTVVATITVDQTFHFGIFVRPDGQRAYVTNDGVDNGMPVIDTSSNMVVAKVATGAISLAMGFIAPP